MFQGEGVLFGAAFLVVAVMHVVRGSASGSAKSQPPSSGFLSPSRSGSPASTSIRGERILLDSEGTERIAFGRDAYSYAHLPMIVGIVLFAFAMKIVIAHVGDELDTVAAFALCGGSGRFLITFSAIRIRVERRSE